MTDEYIANFTSRRDTKLIKTLIEMVIDIFKRNICPNNKLLERLASGIRKTSLKPEEDKYIENTAVTETK